MEPRGESQEKSRTQTGKTRDSQAVPEPKSGEFEAGWGGIFQIHEQITLYLPIQVKIFSENGD
jgi:hypothetical protein